MKKNEIINTNFIFLNNKCINKNNKRILGELIKSLINIFIIFKLLLTILLTLFLINNYSKRNYNFYINKYSYKQKHNLKYVKHKIDKYTNKKIKIFNKGIMFINECLRGLLTILQNKK